MENLSLELLSQKYNVPTLLELQNTFPVPVGEICKQLGINASYEDLPDNESGKIFLKDKKCFIQVNYSHSPTRRRFTVAHELGHYCLHQDILNQNSEILERNTLSTVGVDVNEIEANNFAAELLMPAQEFIKQYNSLGIIKKIAEYFFVSELAVQTRLLNLGINTNMNI
jgi:Zn-dependent peptidase ImmA (M78 family)